MINKRICSAILAGTILTSLFPITAFGASVGSVDTDKVTGQDMVQGQQTVYSEIQLNDTSTNVFLTVDDSELLVSLPSTIIVSGTPNNNGEYIGNFSVGVEGDMAANKIVTIEPESYSAALKQTGKEDEEALISQEQTSFTTQDFADKTVTTGSVTAQGLTAGSWNSEFNFVINVNKVNTFYSSLALAAQDINDNTIGTESSVADLFSAQEAACGAFSNGSGYSIEVLKDLNEPAITLNKDVSLNLNNHTLNFNTGAGLTTNNNLTIKNGTINTTNASRGISSNATTSTFSVDNIVLNANSVSGFNSILFGIYTKSLNNSINGLTLSVNNVSANSAGGLVISGDKNRISDIKNTEITLRAYNNLGVGIQSNGTTDLTNINIDAKTSGTGTNACAMGINVSTSSKVINILKNVNIQAISDKKETGASSYGIITNNGTININDINIYVQADMNSVANAALSLQAGTIANIHGGIFETNIDTQTAVDGSDCTNAGIVSKGTLNIDETNNKVIVKGANSAISVNSTAAVVKINGGTYSSPNHGGIYNMNSKTIDINSAYLYNSKTNGELSDAPCTAFGGMYSSGTGTITVTNSTILGGNHGYRQKDGATNITFKNSYIEGINDVFSIASGTLNIDEGVRVKSKTGTIIEANPAGTINDPYNVLGLN
ncbi:MAG: beta strand repeat-containing protein [Candidatus Gastranaerophilaceae bacterium]